MAYNIIKIKIERGKQKMKKLYTVSFYKAFKETSKELKNVNVNGEKMNVLFCKNDKGIFVIACKYRKEAPYKSCGHWHGGNSYYDVYFRKNFKSREEGNAFYMKVKTTRTI